MKIRQKITNEDIKMSHQNRMKIQNGILVNFPRKSYKKLL